MSNNWEIKTGSPGNSEGNNGDSQIRWLGAQGLYIFVKYNGKWYSQRLSDKALTLSDEISQTSTAVATQTIQQLNVTRATVSTKFDMTGSGSNFNIPGASIGYANLKPDANVFSTKDADATILPVSTGTGGNGFLEIKGTATEIEVNATSPGTNQASFQIGLPNDVDIDGDLSIGGALTFGGTVSNNLDSVSLGTFTITESDSDALLVENSAGTNLFRVDTTSGLAQVSWLIPRLGVLDTGSSSGTRMFGMSVFGNKAHLAKMTDLGVIDTTAITIDLSNTNVGIGTGVTSPSSKLHIMAEDPVLTIEDTTDTDKIMVGFLSGGDQRGFIKTDDNITLSLQEDGGSVAIGSISAQEKLEIAGSVALTTTGTDDRVVMYKSSADLYPKSKLHFHNTSGISFYASNGATPYTPKFKILPDGNVGIGTTNPPEKLSVLGNISASPSSGTGKAAIIASSSDEPQLSLVSGTATEKMDLRVNTDATKTTIDIQPTTGLGRTKWIYFGADADAVNFGVSDLNTSLFTGTGWGVKNDGTTSTIYTDDLYVRGQMTVWELVINQIRATNGSLVVTSAAKINEVSGSGSFIVTTIMAFTIEAEDSSPHPFANNDLIIAKKVHLDSTAITEYKFKVTDASYGNANQFKAVCSAGDTGDRSILIGETFVRVGNTTNTNRQGGVYLTSDDADSPFIDIWDGVDAWADWQQAGMVKARIGRLDGVSGATNEFGLMAGEGFTANTHSFIKASNLGVGLYNSPIELFKGATRKIVISPGDGTTIGTDASQPYIAIGSDVVDGTWSGSDKGILFTQADDGTVTFDMGQANENYIKWQSNTGTLSMKGSIEIVSGGWSDPNDETGAIAAGNAASAAQTTANTANTAANTAQTTADTASTAASTAQNTADNAQTTANTASTTATNITTGAIQLDLSEHNNSVSGWTDDTVANQAASDITTLETTVGGLSTDLSSAEVNISTLNTTLQNTSLSDLANDTPSGSGLFMDATNLGYYDNGTWKTYMNNSGGFYLTGSGDDSLSWDGTNLRIGKPGMNPSVSQTFNSGACEIHPSWLKVFGTGATVQWIHPGTYPNVTGAYGFKLTNDVSAWDIGWYADLAYERSQHPTFTYDILVNHGHPATMIGFTDYNNRGSAGPNSWNHGDECYIYFQDGMLRLYAQNNHQPGNDSGGEYSAWTHLEPKLFRIVIQVNDTGATFTVYAHNDFSAHIYQKTLTGVNSADYISPAIRCHYHNTTDGSDWDGSVIFLGASFGGGDPPVTTIAGNTISTGQIRSSNYVSGATYSTSGTEIDLWNGAIYAEQFRIGSDGTANFKGNITGASGTFSGTLQIGGSTLTADNTFNSNTEWSDVAGTTNAPDNNATNTNAPETANQTGGSVGGWTVDSNSIYTGTKDWTGYTTGGITITTYNGGGFHSKNFYIDSSGNAFFKGNGEFTGSVTATSGTFTGAVNASSGTFTGNVDVGSYLNINNLGGSIKYGAGTKYNINLGTGAGQQLYNWTYNGQSVNIGYYASGFSYADYRNVNIGYKAGYQTGAAALYYGDQTGFNNYSNVNVGYKAGYGYGASTKAEPWANVIIGHKAGYELGRWSDRPSSVESHSSNSTVGISHGINVVIGAECGGEVSSGANVAIGAGAFQSHRYPTGGREAEFNAWSNVYLGENVAIGYGNSYQAQYNKSCTSIGAWSGVGHESYHGYTNSGTFGANTHINASNEYRIGSSNTRIRQSFLTCEADPNQGTTPVVTINQNTYLSEVPGTQTEVLTLRTGDDLSDITANNRYISFRSREGTILGHITNQVTYGTFTGAHWSQNPYYTNEGLRSKFKQGLIVYSIGELMQEEGDASIDKAWPYVDVASKRMDPAVMGVIASVDPDNPEDNMVDAIEGLDMITYNALGEGMILVTDSNGNIETGDYICSSDREGLGEKQNDDILHNYTVAKATVPCDFSDVEIDQEFGHKVKLIACTYHCG